MLDVTNGVLYIAVSVPNPRKGQTTVVTVLQDAAGLKPTLTCICHWLALVQLVEAAAVLACTCTRMRLLAHPNQFVSA